MAGLLDIFGTGGSQSMGLLGMSPEDINRARDDAQAQALYSLAGRLFQGGNTGQSIAQGLQMGQQAYKEALQGQMQDKLQTAQLQDALLKRQEAQAVKQRQAQVQQLLGQAYQPAMAGQPAQEMYGEDIMGQRVGEGMTPAVAARPSSFDIQSIAPQLMTIPEGRTELSNLMNIQKSMQPEYKEVNGALYEISVGMPPKLVAGSKKRDTVTVGNVVLDKDNMSVLYTAPDAPAASIKEFQDFMKLPKNQQTAYIQLQDQKRPSTTINMPNEGERKAATLASRLNFSVGQMNEAIGLDPKAAMPSTPTEIARFVSRTDFLPNKLNTDQRQVVEAAQEDILDAALTLGTGAAYSREQLAGYKKSYFPQLGDSETAVKTKQERLNNLLKSAEVASGRAASQITAPIPKLPQEQNSGLPAGVTVKKKG